MGLAVRYATTTSRRFKLLEDLGPQERLFLFIKSDGGNGRASLRMVNLIQKVLQTAHRHHPLGVRLAATMIALRADEIRMGPMAYITTSTIRR